MHPIHVVKSCHLLLHQQQSKYGVLIVEEYAIIIIILVAIIIYSASCYFIFWVVFIFGWQVLGEWEGSARLQASSHEHTGWWDWDVPTESSCILRHLL